MAMALGATMTVGYGYGYPGFLRRLPLIKLDWTTNGRRAQLAPYINYRAVWHSTPLHITYTQTTRR